MQTCITSLQFVNYISIKPHQKRKEISHHISSDPPAALSKTIDPTSFNHSDPEANFQTPHSPSEVCQLQKEKLCPTFVEHPSPSPTIAQKGHLDARGKDTLGCEYTQNFSSVLVTSPET